MNTTGSENRQDSGLLKRNFPTTLVESLAQWNSQRISADLSTKELAEWIHRVRLVASHASFLGHARIVQLCKALVVGLNSLTDNRTTLKLENVDCVLQETWQLIVDSVKQPQRATVQSVEECMREMQLALQLTEMSLREPLELLSVQAEATKPFVENGTTGQSTESHSTNSESTEHRDESVYCREVIHDLDYCADEESWIVAQLASVAEDLATGHSADRPAQRLLKVLKGHRFFQKVDRVCLAGRVPHANQLVIVDSANSDRAPKNILRKGYSCFVNPQGSLFAMQPSTVRVFAECNAVLESFRRQSKPAQRSIALIAEQGMRSGLCIAIGRENLLQGFLFLNSVDPSLFDSITSRYAPLLSLFGLLGTISLDASGFHAIETKPKWLIPDLVPANAIDFDELQLITWLNAHFAHWFDFQIPINIQTSIAANNFLYLPRTIISSICDFVSRMSWNHELLKGSFSLSIRRVGEVIRLGFAHRQDFSNPKVRERLSALVTQFNQEMQNMPLSCRLESTAISLEFPYEPTLNSANRQFYSIVY